MTSELLRLGWSPLFEQAYQAFLQTLPAPERDHVSPVRLVGVERQAVRTWGGEGEQEALISGALRRQEPLQPAIGDWGIIQQSLEGPPRLTALLPRHTTFSRAVGGDEGRGRHRVREQVIAANVDIVLIVTAPDADFELNRLARYVQAVQQSGAEAVLVLNKADLHPDVQWWVQQLRALAPNARVLPVAAATGEGVNDLRALVQDGMTLALIGSSGVGKSTLTNCLLGQDVALTGAIRASDQQGRHTTTSRTLYLLPSGGLLIDNPGLRDIAVWDADALMDGQLEELATHCRFRKCTHTTEPGCAVRSAAENGELSAERLLKFQKQSARPRR